MREVATLPNDKVIRLTEGRTEVVLRSGQSSGSHGTEAQHTMARRLSLQEFLPGVEQARHGPMGSMQILAGRGQFGRRQSTPGAIYGYCLA